MNSKGQAIREIIEVKPKSQTLPPKEQKRRTQKFLREVATYAVNQAKWKAAEEFCTNRRMKFRILTEDHLLPNKK